MAFEQTGREGNQLAGQASVRTQAVTVAVYAFSPETDAKAKGKGRIGKRRALNSQLR